MELTKLFVTGRSASIQLDDGGLYQTRKPYTLTLNDQPWGTADTVITSLYGLWPDTRYTLRVFDGDTQVEKLTFTTEEESFTLNVRSFGAVGDGVHDDTPAIQAAINCCPKHGRVLSPAGP